MDDLKIDNMSASNSLKESLDETLTLYRLGLSENFKSSFSTVKGELAHTFY